MPNRPFMGLFLSRRDIRPILSFVRESLLFSATFRSFLRLRLVTVWRHAGQSCFLTVSFESSRLMSFSCCRRCWLDVDYYLPTVRRQCWGYSCLRFHNLSLSMTDYIFLCHKLLLFRPDEYKHWSNDCAAINAAIHRMAYELRWGHKLLQGTDDYRL